MQKNCLTFLVGALLFGCAQMAPEPYEPSPGHVTSSPAQPPAEGIPPLVQDAVPELPEPAAPEEQEKYTVVVNEVPVNELLFALARDANLNVDVDPRVTGIVTLNAVEQTLPQLLDRIARQVDIRYELADDNLYITPDEPFFRTYKVNYVNMSRDAAIEVRLDTQISSGGGGGEGVSGSAEGGSSSSTEVASVSNNRFWASLVANVQAILADGGSTGAAAGGGEGQLPVTSNVIPHAEAGLLTVRATDHQHRLVQELIDNTLLNAHRQVLIQATIVEVTLSRDYQAGIDWTFLSKDDKAGFNISSLGTTAGSGIVPLGTLTSFVLSYVDPNTDRDRINVTLRLMEEFGDVNVLSSPQIMALNNQTAVLKVVDNEVYFSINVETTTGTNVTDRSVETEIHTVPVGIVLSVTPQINENDSVILQVRPTISRVREFVEDPNPELDAQTPNLVPVIQTREMESILRMNNGQVAVLGGLMQDESRATDTAVPGLSRVPLLGEAFRTRGRDHQKTELVVFLRPIVVRNPSLEGDLTQYKSFLNRGP